MPDDSRRDEVPDDGDESTEPDVTYAPLHEVDKLRLEVEQLRDEIDEYQEDISRRTVDRDAVRSELKQYVRRRVRTARARGWGPYIVLLYGSLMTIGAFYFLDGGWAILAMIVIWLSTLGLYVLMVLTGSIIGALGIPRRTMDAFSRWRK